MKPFLVKSFSIFFLSFLLTNKGISQQKKILFFDKNWQQSNSQTSQFFECECYFLPSGALDGPFKCYLLKTNILVKSYNYSNNILDGEIKEFFVTGELKTHAFYQKGLPINTWKEWDIKGNLIVDKEFDANSVFITDKKIKDSSEYEKIYFGNKEFEAPIYSSECIQKNIENEKYKCSQIAMLSYYKTPPLPPQYFNKSTFLNKIFFAKLKYKISSKGKVDEVNIIESTGDTFLDELAEIHLLNMMPFESAKSYENPIEYWQEAILEFNFKK